MMKKAFTLAEVLITLTIVGVVASVTLPVLNQNTTEQARIAAYKKLLNSLNEAGQRAEIRGGYTYGSASGLFGSAGTYFDENGNQNYRSIQTIFSEELDIAPGGWKVNLPGSSNVIVLSDGTALLCGVQGIVPVTNDKGEVVLDENNNPVNSKDRWMAVDINGKKGPNAYSSCSKKGCPEGSRSIQDRFFVTFSGSHAYPGKFKAHKEYNVDSGTDAERNWAALWAAGQEVY